MDYKIDDDINNALNIINHKKVNLNEYKTVKVFPNRSLKTFKKYKLENKNVLTKCNSISEVLDLLSYDSNINCYSNNRLDEYILNYMLALTSLKYDEYIDYVFSNKKISKDVYDKVKDKLDDKTRYFFDAIYKQINSYNIFKTRMCDLSRYNYDVQMKNIRYILNHHYYKINNKSLQHPIDFTLCKDFSVPLYFEDNSFDFINLSLTADLMDREKLNYTIRKINDIFVPLLKENGKIQAFTSKKDIQINGFDRLETRSIDDPDSEKVNCKKEYAYVYKQK